jgi:hypothetical protein
LTSGGIINFFARGFRLQFVGQLPELVEIDPRPESEGMWNRLRRRTATNCGALAQTGADRSVHGFLNGIPSSRARCLRSPAKSSSSVRVVRMADIMNAPILDVKGVNPRRDLGSPAAIPDYTVILPRTWASSISTRVPESTTAPRSMTA